MSFQRYEDDYAEVASELKQCFKQVTQSSLTAEEVEDCVERAEGMLTELREMKQSMQIGLVEVAAGAERAGCERRLREYQADIDAMTKDLQRAKRTSAEKSNRSDLMGGPLSANAGRRSEEADLLRVQQQSDSSLHRSKMDIENTLKLGAGTLDELRAQREKLQRSKDKLKDVDGNVAISTKVMRRMERTIATNKLIRYATIGILLVGIGAMLYRLVK